VASKRMTPKLETAARKILHSATYGEPSPLDNNTASFAHTVVVFLEDYRDKRLTADEVCDTLLAAAVARNFFRPVPDTKLTGAEKRPLLGDLKKP
jgi:hypothetical protein